jgi:hypothetical protein
MIRPASSHTRLVLAATAALLATGCGGGSEQQLLQQYFQAARLRDQTTLTNIATVSWDIQQRGTVTDFEVTNTGEEQKRPLEMRTLRKAHEDAQAADEEFSKRKKAYQDENIEAIDRVIKAERSNGKLSGRDAQVQTAWTKWRQEMSEHAKKVQDARMALSDERGVAEISVYNPRNPVDVTEYDGELLSKDVTVNAQVRMADGQSASKTLVVTMQRAVLKKEGSPDVNGRWIITDIKDSSAPTTN